MRLGIHRPVNARAGAVVVHDETAPVSRPETPTPTGWRAGFLWACCRQQWLQAAAVLCATLILFFSTPLRNPHEWYGSDLLLHFVALQPELPSGYQPKIGGNSDSVTALQPFYYQSREQLRHGIFPLWDPYIGLGVPHFANESSAVLALPNLAFYLLTFKQALLVSASLKLFLGGMFAYLFFRRLKIGHGPALIGAIAFMFCGYQIYWLPNSAPAVTPMLPMTLYCVESALQSPARRRLGWLIGVAVSVALGVFGGHPETFSFIALFLAGYTIVRVAMVGEVWPRRAALIGAVGTAAIAGIVLSAVQLLPFAEYAKYSNAFAARNGHFIPPVQHPASWLINFFPNLYGNPSDPYYSFYKVLINGAPDNLLEANGAYVGALSLFLLLVACCFVRRRPLIALFVATALLLFAYQYNQFHLLSFTHRLPLLSGAQPNRSQPVTAFCISAAAAFGLQGLRETKLSRWRIAALVAAGAALTGIALALAPAAWRLGHLDLHEAAFRAYMPRQLAYIAIGMAIGMVGLVLITWRVRQRHAWTTAVGLVLVGAVVFSESGWLLHDFNPTVPGYAYLPQTPSIHAVQSIVGGDNVMLLTDKFMRADVSAFYDLRIPGNYDALGVQDYYLLYGRLFKRPPEGSYPADVDPYILKLFGMQWLVGDQPPGTQIGETTVTTVSPKSTVQPVLPDPIRQIIVPGQDNLDQFDIPFFTGGRVNHCTVHVALVALWDNNRTVGQRDFACDSARNGQDEHFGFPPEPDSAGKAYRIEIRSDAASKANSLFVAVNAAANPAGWQLTINDKPQAGAIGTQLRYGAAQGYIQRYTDTYLSIYQYTGSPGTFWTVGGVTPATSASNALDILGAATTDPTKTVVLTAPPIAGLTGEATPARTVAQGPDHVVLSAERQTPGYLVAAMTDFPGWKARVNGRSVPIERANYAFMAVPLAGGANTVELYYDPASFKVGVAVSFMMLFALLAAGVLQWRWWRHDRRAAHESIPPPAPE